jgi:hypothetical protein
MIRTILAVLCALWFSVSTAAAQTCGAYPNTLTNGQNADATQVMANFNFILNCVTGSFALQGYIGGLTLSNDAISPNIVVDVAAGAATSDDATTLMKIATFSKNCNAAWAVGSGNGGLDSGSSLAASTWYHVYVIERIDTGVVDELCSTQATSPTLPANYTKKRRIGSIRTDGSAHIISFSQSGDEFLWSTSFNDVANLSPLGTSAVLQTLTVPTGVKVQARYRANIQNFVGVAGSILFTSPDESDQTPSNLLNSLVSDDTSIPAVRTGGEFLTRTNTSAQIRYRATVNNVNFALVIYTYGWVDTRGRFN